MGRASINIKPRNKLPVLTEVSFKPGAQYILKNSTYPDGVRVYVTLNNDSVRKIFYALCKVMQQDVPFEKFTQETNRLRDSIKVPRPNLPNDVPRKPRKHPFTRLQANGVYPLELICYADSENCYIDNDQENQVKQPIEQSETKSKKEALPFKDIVNLTQSPKVTKTKSKRSRSSPMKSKKNRKIRSTPNKAKKNRKFNETVHKADNIAESQLILSCIEGMFDNFSKEMDQKLNAMKNELKKELMNEFGSLLSQNNKSKQDSGFTGFVPMEDPVKYIEEHMGNEIENRFSDFGKSNEEDYLRDLNSFFK